MARLNFANVRISATRAWMIRLTIRHFGLNNMFAANGLPYEGHDKTRLYFPAISTSSKHA